MVEMVRDQLPWHTPPEMGVVAQPTNENLTGALVSVVSPMKNGVATGAGIAGEARAGLGGLGDGSSGSGGGYLGAPAGSAGGSDGV